MSQLNKIDGINIQQGLLVLNGNLQRYIKLLRQFIEGHKVDVSYIQEQLDNNKTEDARHRAHTLKGVAGTLGLSSIQTQAAELELNLKKEVEKKHITENLAKLDTLLNQLDLVLESIIKQANSMQKKLELQNSPMNSTQLNKLLEQIESLVSLGDTSVNQLIDESQQELLPVFGEQAKLLLRQIEAFDYPVAMETVKKMMTTVQQKGSD